MSEIHYFPRYSQPENVVTNNTLLLLLRLHQYNRFKFEKFMELICGEQEVELAVSWLKFSQQKGTGKSVADGFIAQDSIKIAVETKLNEGFDPLQLEHHFNVFEDEQHKLLILLSPSPVKLSSKKFESVHKLADRKHIQIVQSSFEDIVEKARSCLSDHDEEMNALVDDYESFCSDQGLLPRDRYTLFVPPCGRSFEYDVQFRMYYCPKTWNRRKAKYLGIYTKRSVRAIGEIAKITACTVDTAAETVSVDPGSPSLTQDEEQRILGAAKSIQKGGGDISTGHQFYLCDAFEETDFQKETHGGIFGHRYFDMEEVLGDVKVPQDLKALAELLRTRKWR